jgi:hypothetical protein
MALQESGGVVLLDAPAGGGDFDRSILERMGHRVVECSGPAAGTLCPLLGGEGCALFEQAHGIVFELDLDVDQHRAIVARYRELGPPGMPIRVVVKPGQAERYAELLEQVEVWNHDPSVADLDGFAAEVEAADRFA